MINTAANQLHNDVKRAFVYTVVLNVGADVTLGGRLFHASATATVNARSPTVERFAGGIRAELQPIQTDRCR